MLANQVFQCEQPGIMVQTFGRHKQMFCDPAVFQQTIATAKANGSVASRVCVIKPPAGPGKTGFQKIASSKRTTSLDDRLEADGAWTNRPNAAVVIPTGDCPVVALSNTVNDRRVVFHAGRPALTPDENGNNIVSEAMQACLHNGNTAQSVYAVITGAISPQHFKHDNDGGQRLIKPFLDMYGTKVFKGDPRQGQLDISTLIRHQLCALGVLSGNILHDGLCTYSDVRLASHRREGNEWRNITIVTTTE